MRHSGLFRTQIFLSKTGVNPLLKRFPKDDFEAFWLPFEGDLEPFRQGLKERFFAGFNPNQFVSNPNQVILVERVADICRRDPVLTKTPPTQRSLRRPALKRGQVFSLQYVRGR